MSNTIVAGQNLGVGEYIASNNGWFCACLQPDGKFYIYRGRPGDHLPTPFWNSESAGAPGGCHAVLQHDGNFCVYSGGAGTESAATFIWGALSAAGPPGGRYVAVLQDDGNFCIYPDGAQGEHAIWCSGVHVPAADIVRGVRVLGENFMWFVDVHWSGGGRYEADAVLRQMRSGFACNFIWEPTENFKSNHPHCRLLRLPPTVKPGFELWPAAYIAEDSDGRKREPNHEAEHNVIFDPNSPFVAVYGMTDKTRTREAGFVYHGASDDLGIMPK